MVEEVYPSSDVNYPDLPDLGSGYEGESWPQEILNASLCYQIATATGDTINAATWGAKGVQILLVMAEYTQYLEDDGYDLRNYGTGMAIAFDWLYPLLSADQRTSVCLALNKWLSEFESGGFENNHPVGNYFAGYYAAKAYTAIATEGDNSDATLWSDFLDRVQRGGANSVGSHTGIQAYYANAMVGGGWMEGWGYGSLAAQNMSLPSLAVLTGKNLDLIQDPAAPFSYPLDLGLHVIHFTWPNLASMDDRDLIHTGGGYSNPKASLSTLVSALLARWNKSLAPQVHAYARAIRATDNGTQEWQDMLFWDPNASDAPYSTLPTSYLASGMNAVAMRSDWSTSAVFATFRATAYIDNPDAQEENHDAGGLAIIKGGTPFLPNPTGAMSTTYPDNSSQPSEDSIYTVGNDQWENILYNGPSGQDDPPVDQTPPVGTKISIYEDAGSDVRFRGANLGPLYSNVGAWTRDVVYLRPNQFVVYDRATLSSVVDPYIAWHLFLSATENAANGPIFDVSGTKAGYIGRMTSLLPASATIGKSDPLGDGKVTRVTIRPAAPATQDDFLTVFDAASSAGAAATASVITSSANVTGALLQSGSASNVVIFGNSPTLVAISGSVTFTVPAGTASVVMADLAASTSYDVTDNESAGHQITVQAGSAHSSTADGTLHFSLSASGAVSVP